MMSLLMTMSFIALMFLRVPVSMAIGLAALLPLALLNRNLIVIPQFMLQGMSSYTLLAVPFFILAGNLFNTLGLSRRIWDFAESLVGHIRGGLGHVMVLANMIFAGISGSALADAAGLGAMGIPAMMRRGYARAYSAALTLSSSVIGPMIPPSINLVIFGVIAQESIGRLFLAGVIPGFLIGFAMMGMVYFLAATGRTSVAQSTRAPAREVGRRLLVSSTALAVPVLVLAGMGFGLLTPTEVGVACVFYALLLGIIYRECGLSDIWRTLIDSFRSTVAIMYIIAVSMVAGWIYTYDGVSQAVAAGLLEFTDNKWVVLFLINLILLVLGAILEPIPVLILTTPIFLPVVTELGVDPIHYGIIANLNITIGIITPPMGIGLYVMMGITPVKFGDLVRACLPFLGVLLGCLMVITYIPILSTWFPELLMGARR
jgi:tripartite ATP-independent transporter DctM subunit